MNEILVLTCSAETVSQQNLEKKAIYVKKKWTGGCVKATWARCDYHDDCDDDDGLDHNHHHLDSVGLDAGKASQLRHE